MADEQEVSTGATSTGTTSTGTQSATVDAGASGTQTATATLDNWGEVSKLFGGAKSPQDVHKIYASSSAEARKQSSERARLEQELNTLKTVRAELGAHQQQQGPRKYLGLFENRDQYLANMEHDPEATLDKLILHRMQSNPEFKKMFGVNPEIEKQVGEIKSFQQQQAERAQMSEAVAKYPEFAKGGAMNQIVEMAWQNDGGALLSHLQKTFAGTEYNPFEVFGAVSAFKALREEHEALKIQLGVKAKAAGVAGNGSGGKGAKVPANVAEEMDQIEKDSGEQVNPHMKNAFAKAFGGRDRTKRER